MTLHSLIAAISGARNAIVASLAVGCLCLAIGYWRGAAAEKSACRTERAEANAKAMATDVAAKDRAAEDRVADAVRAAETEKELVDAIKDIPDTVPGAMRVARGCVQLRQAGTADADLPPVCRPHGADRGQAGAGR